MLRVLHRQAHQQIRIIQNGYFRFLNRLPGYNTSRFSVSLVIIYEVTTLKFECDKSLLSAAIDGVSRAITNRAAIPVLEGIYLKAEGFQLTLTGYDMEMGITTNIECNVQVPGETAPWSAVCRPAPYRWS